jgi:hypothetical protein
LSGTVWKQGTLVKLSEVLDAEDMIKEKYDALKKVGIVDAIGIPIKYSGKILAVVVFYTTTTQQYTKTDIDDLSFYTNGLISSSIFRSDKNLGTNLFAGVNPLFEQKMEGAFQYIIKQGVFNSKVAFQEVVWFFQLGIPNVYFEKYDVEEIGKHLHSIAAAKRLAQAAGSPFDVFVTLETPDKSFYCFQLLLML